MGDVMDADTESMLWPQVVNEALAREIATMLQRLHRSQSVAVTIDEPSDFSSTPTETHPHCLLQLFWVIGLSAHSSGFFET